LNPSSRFASGRNSGFQVLWGDGERVSCRGKRHGDDTVPVLALISANERPAPAVLARLAHEYELRDELDAAWAARPLEFVHEQGEDPKHLELVFEAFYSRKPEWGWVCQSADQS
jgi:hypothetical protein